MGVAEFSVVAAVGVNCALAENAPRRQVKSKSRNKRRKRNG